MPNSFELMVVPGGFSKAGIPDHLFCCPVEITPDMVGKTMGMFVAVEAKTATGKTSGIQKLRLAEITKAGGLASVVHGIDELPKLGWQIYEVFGL